MFIGLSTITRAVSCLSRIGDRYMNSNSSAARRLRVLPTSPAECLRSRARGLARLVLGSVAMETLKRAITPVVVLRPKGLQTFPTPEAPEIDAQKGGRRFTILVALDATEKADAALAPPARLG